MKRAQFLPLLGVTLAIGFSSISPARAQQQQPQPDQPEPSASQNSSAAPAPLTAQQRADLVRKRAQWFHDQRAYPYQHIPEGALQRAIEQRDRMRTGHRAQSAGQSLNPLAIISFPGDALWHPTGPQPTNQLFGNINGAGGSGSPTTSGRVTAIAVDPSDPNGKIVYIGGAAGGVWKTIDGGATWAPLTDSQPSLAVGSIAIDPNDCTPAPCKTIYVGTGEENFNIDAFYGAGILKSTDAGATWTQIGASTFAQTLGPQTGGAYIGQIAVQPGDSNIVLAAVTFIVNGTIGGIYRSTNGGTTWAEVAAPRGLGATSVVFESTSVATQTATAWMAMGDPFGESVNGIYKSIDSGATWTKQTSTLPTANLGRITLGYAQNTAGTAATVYAAIADSSTTSSNLLGIFKTVDGGATWNSVTGPAGGFCNSQCFFDMAIGVNPADAQNVVLGGGAYTDNFTSLFESTNGGGKWTGIGADDFSGPVSGIHPHVDTHAIVFTPSTATARLYVGNDGGIWRTDTPLPAGVSPTWLDLNPGLALAQFYPGPSAGIGDEDYGFGGTQDNDTEVFSGTPDWTAVQACGDGAFTAIDTQIPTTVYTTCAPGSGPGLVSRSVFNGAVLAGPSTSFAPADFGIAFEQMEFTPPLTIDADNPSTLYFGTCRIWQTFDSAATWNALTGDLASGTDNFGAPCGGAGNITTMDVPQNTSSNIVFAGTSNGTVWRNGPFTSWTEIDNLVPGQLPGRHITAVRGKPGDTTGDFAYVTFSGFGSCAGCDLKGHVFKTKDGGTTWTDISGDLPDAPVNAIIVDHNSNPTFDAVYIGTDVGVFSCPDPEAATPCKNWTVIGDGLPNSPVLGLAMRPTSRILRAFTHGRSAWHIQLTDEQPPSLPALSSLTPAAVMAGSPTTTVAVTGVNFGPNTKVAVGTGPFAFIPAGLTTTFVSTTQLSVSVPANLLLTGTVVGVGLTDPLGTSTDTLPFTVMNPIPHITGHSLNPTTGMVEEPVTFTLTGTGFVNGTQLIFNGNQVAGFGTASNGGTTLSVTISESALTSPMAGTNVSVNVSNSLPGGGPAPAADSFNFPVVANSGPEAAFNPSSIFFFPALDPGGSATLATDVQLSNSGTGTLNLATKATITGPNAADFAFAAATGGAASTPACADFTAVTTVTIAAGAKCFFNMTFKPLGTTPGFRTATLTINDNDDDTPRLIPISGIVNGPIPQFFDQSLGNFCTVSACFPTPVNFGSVPKGTPFETDGILQNGGSGTTPLGVVTVSILTSADSGDFTIGAPSAGSFASACSPLGGGFNLPSGVGNSCGLGLTFTPSKAGVQENATLEFTFSNLGIGKMDVPLTGIGVVPTITTINPSIVATGGPTFTMTVTGTNYVLGSVVNLNNNARLTTFVSPTQLLASIPATDLTTAGSSAITVTNPAGGGTSEPKSLIVAQAPTGTNDDFAEATDTSTTPFRVTQDTTLFTTNTAGTTDPTPGCGNGSKAKSAWFKFVAPASGKVVADTRYSSYGTILSVWTGTANSLTAVAGACASGNILTTPAESFVGFPVTNGTTYFLMVTDASPSGAVGTRTLTFRLDFASAQPANDDWANATVVAPPATGTVYSNTVNTILATINTGGHADPTPLCAPTGAANGGIANSAWYSFTPTSGTPVTADTLTSLDDTILSVWTGSPTTGFTQIACNDNAGTGPTQVLQSQVSFTATASTTYYFMISSVLGDGGTAFHLSLTSTQAGPAAKLAFTQQPTNTAVGAAITPSVQVSVEDAQGIVVTTATNSITVAIGTNPGGGTLSGTATVSAVNGVATFPGLSINKLGTGYTLTASATSLTQATSTAFNITAGPPSKLAITVQPTNTTAGVAINPSVQVSVEDSLGNVVTTATNSVTLAIGTNPGVGTLTGTTTVSAVNGVATFPGLSINKTGAGYTLTASSGVLTGTTSSAFNVTAGPAVQLAFAVQPSNVAAAASITPSAQVSIQDAQGNVVTTATNSVTVAIGTNPGGGTLSGTATLTAVSGVATFPGLSINKVGTGYTLKATSGVLTAATSSAFNVTAGAATQLSFTVQPTNTAAGLAITPSVQVSVEDAGGNVVTGSSVAVTLAIGTNPSGGTLSGTAMQNAVSGVATFPGLSINKAGTGYTLKATSGALTLATSTAFNITAGAASQLAFTVQPTNTNAGAPITPSVQVSIEDAGGNVVTSATSAVNLAIGTNPGGGTLSGTATQNAVAGVATFPGMSINNSGTGYTLKATSGALTLATSSAFNVIAGGAAKLIVTVQPTSVAAGAAIAPAVQVTIEDSQGNLVTSATNPVTMAIGTNPGGGTLSGTATVNAVAGVATFSTLSINKVGTGYTLTANATSLTGATSGGFNVTAGAPTQLAFTVQPSNVVAAASISPSVQVSIEDAQGNVVTSSTSAVALVIGTNPGSGTLSGTATQNAVAGVATFPGLSINKTGTGYTLKATSGALTLATSSAFNVTPGTATQLAFTVQPSNVTAAASITPSAQVSIEDAQGNVVTASTSAVTLAIGTNPGSGTLSGTATVNAVAGVATFPGLSINKTGTGYTLTANSGALTGATSSAFNVTAGAATQLAFTAQPTNTAAGAAIAPSVQVSIEDAGGNLVASATNSVTVAIATNPGGGALAGTATVNAVAGVATFSTLSINKTGTGYTLKATSGALTLATSSGFNVTPGVATQLAFTVQPTNTAAAASISPNVQVSIEDAQGNVVTSSTSAVALAIGTNPGTGTLSGTATVNAVAGVATFPGLSINKTGTGYTLKATSGALTLATSSGFNVTPGVATQLAFTVQPTNTAAAASISPNVQVSIEDAQGNVVTASTSAVTLAIGTNPGTGTLSGTATLNAVAGVATFPGLSINKTGTGYTLKATSGALTLATSSAFNVTAGAATQLAFTVQPSTVTIAVSIAPSVQVSIEDAQGNVVTTATNAVTLTIGTNPGNGTLSGTLTQSAVAGVATFPGLSINNAGTAYTLKATATNLTAATSTAFNVNATPPNNFTNTAGDNQWTTAANWSQGLPTSGQVVTDTGGFNIILASGAQSVSAMNFNNGGTLTISGGSLTFTSGSTVNNAVINGGTLTANGALAIGGTTTLSSGTLGGTGVVTTTGLLTWSGGNISMTGGTGAVNTNGGITETGAVTLSNGTINNAGTVTMNAGGTISMTTSAAVNNATGTWNVQSGGISLTGGGAAPSFTNGGTFNLAAGAGTFTVTGVAFNNNGTANLNTGTLSLLGGGASAGKFNVAAGTTLSLGGSNFSATGASSVTGAGSVLFTGGASTIAGTYNIAGTTTVGVSPADTNGVANFNSASATTANLNLNAGALGGTGNLTVSGTMTWAGGTLSNTGTTTIAAISGVLNLTGTNSPKQTAGTLSIAGTANVTGALDVGGGGATINVLSGGKFNLAADVFIGSVTVPGPTSFNNSGTLTKSGGAGNGGFIGSVAFNNSGTINASSGTLHLDGGELQTGVGSATHLNGGNLSFNPGLLNINGGTLDGSGTITGNVTNAATMKPGNSPGAITISGSYTQAATGILNIELDGTGAGQFSVLNIGTTATLGGTLNISLGGGFLPAVTNAFKIITFTDGRGTSNFATETGLSQGSVFLQPTFNPADLTLTAITSTVSLNPNSLDFSNVLLNTTSGSMSASLTNNTGASITISSITPSGANAAEFPLQTGSGICAQNAVLAAGSSCNLTYVFKPTALGPRGPISVTVADSRPGNSVLTLNGTGIAPDVTISKSHTGDFTVGSNGVYTIKVTNNGTSPTTGNITVTDTLATGLTFVSNAGANWACSAAAQVVTCTYSGPALAAAGGNSTVTLTVSVAPGAFPSVTNTATVADPNDSKTTDKSATDAPTNIDNALPTQSSFSPNLGLVAGATSAQQITITGTGFNDSTQVILGSNPPLTGTANAAGTSLTVSVPASELAPANAGNLTLKVTNPVNPTSNAGGGTATTTLSFPLVAFTAAQDASTPGTITVKAGTPATVKIDYSTNPANSPLPGALTITCALPQSLTGAACTVNGGTIAAGATSGSSTITITAIPTTGGTTGTSTPGPRIGGQGPWSTYLLWLLAATLTSMLGMMGAVRQRALSFRRAPMYLMLGVIILAAGGLVGCTTTKATPTPTGPSTLTVTATAADGASVTTTVNITVSN